MAAQKYIVKPQLLVFLMVLFIIIFSALYFVLDNEAQLKQNQLELLQTEKEMYREQLRDLQDNIEYVQKPQGIEQYARAKGMIMPGETQYVAGEGAGLQ
ncbi:MAG: hypothetical protein IIW08_07915 [Clostridia bacterium]|nr:hypothetical protein [Clostridia bacterium]MBQ5771085.1 hypothetical protein [Clostridia bacterium]